MDKWWLRYLQFMQKDPDLSSTSLAKQTMLLKHIISMDLPQEELQIITIWILTILSTKVVDQLVSTMRTMVILVILTKAVQDSVDLEEFRHNQEKKLTCRAQTTKAKQAQIIVT